MSARAVAYALLLSGEMIALHFAAAVALGTGVALLAFDGAMLLVLIALWLHEDARA